MARYSQRPENALKRANEFIEVGKPARALDTLYEVFRNKKWAYNWSEGVLEPIMFKYLDLCVELKKSHIAKEGLFQYRNMFQTVNVGSLENVIRGYLRSAEEKTEAAREHSHQAVLDIDDLDNLATPESILLSAVSGEGAQDRSDRTILTPWVKFLWESYCQCLELLRTNALVEALYHDIARMAYQFCLKYNRKTEFRKLCDKLRKHLEEIGKLPVQTVNVSLTRPETQQFNLETRLIQLEYAIQMELWQEAHKATEDIHNLMTLSKKPPQPKMMANYYQKLAMVFWKAGPNYYAFHAAALFKLYQLNKEMKKNITAEELQRMANRVLLATLSIPLPSAHPEFDRFIETDKSPLEKAQKLAVLLTLTQPPTRFSLLKDIVRYNVVTTASPKLQELYSCLEVTFDPLKLCKKVDEIVSTLKDMEQYVPPLRDVTLVTLIRQVSQIYETITYARLLELSHFGTHFHIERLIVECVRQNDMQIRVDHGKGCVYFGADLSELQREDRLEGPVVQEMPSEQIRSHLIQMAEVLTKCQRTINPDYDKAKHDTRHRAMVKRYHEIEFIEHQRVLQRHKIIEERKEYIEQMNTVREQEEMKRMEELARQQALAEHRRLEQEREERERKRVENEQQMIKARMLQEKVQQISQTAHGQKLLKTLQEEELKNLDAEKIAEREAEELQKERKEQQQKLKNAEKKLDYFERAKRMEEIPLLKQAWKEKQVVDKKFWEQQEADRILQLKQERKLALQHRDRLMRMAADREVFMLKLKERRQVQYQDKLKEFEKQLEVIRKERLEQRKIKRREERRAAYEKQLKDEEERKKQEEEKRKEEEERKRKEEERKKLEEERRKMDVLAEQRRKREEEAMKKMESQKAAEEQEKQKWRRPAAASTAEPERSWRRAEPVQPKEETAPVPTRPEPTPQEGGVWRSSKVESRRIQEDRRPGFDDRDRRPAFEDRDRRPAFDDRDRRPGFDDRDRRPGFDDRDRPSGSGFGPDRQSRSGFGPDRQERTQLGRDRDYDDRDRSSRLFGSRGSRDVGGERNPPSGGSSAFGWRKGERRADADDRQSTPFSRSSTKDAGSNWRRSDRGQGYDRDDDRRGRR